MGVSSVSLLLDLGSCGREGLNEAALCLLENGVSVSDGDGHELHLAPHRFEIVDEWGALGGFFLEPLMASEVSAKPDLEEDEVELLAVESVRVRRRGGRYFFGVYEVGGDSMSVLELGLLGLEG